MNDSDGFPADSSCPLCGGAAEPFYRQNRVWIATCTRCGHRFADLPRSDGFVDQQYGDEYFKGGGAGYTDYLSEKDLLYAHGRRYAEKLREFVEPGRVLDVGAAAGFLLQSFVEAGWTGVGVEPNDTMAAYGREQLGLDIRTGTLEDLPRDMPPFDLVTIIQVIGHFVNLNAALEAVAGLTRPGGHCLIESWNRGSKMARLFGRYWHEYSPPTVLHWLTPEGLAAAMARHGFSEVVRGRPKKYLNGAHAKSLLRYKLGSSAPGRLAGAALGVIPDRLTIRYPSEDLFWTLFRRDD